MEPGSVCCGTSGCRAGAVCKRSFGGTDVCCGTSNDVACDAGYCTSSPSAGKYVRSPELTKSIGCPAGTICVGGGQCQRTQMSISRLSSSRPSSRSSSSSALSASLSLPVISTPKPTPSPSAARPSPKKGKSTSSCTSTPASAPTGAGAWDWVKVEGEKDCVPVLDFLCVKDLFDQLCTSMCEGALL
jgi:hypothetical protein